MQINFFQILLNSEANTSELEYNRVYNYYTLICNNAISLNYILYIVKLYIKILCVIISIIDVYELFSNCEVSFDNICALYKSNNHGINSTRNLPSTLKMICDSCVFIVIVTVHKKYAFIKAYIF